jgi:lipase
MRLHVHDWGPADAEPLLCLHGVTSWGGRFRRLAEERLDAYHVFAPDLRGHGVSDWEPPWNLGTHTDDLVDTLDALHLDRVDVVGHSFGGRLGLELAARRPERVGRLAADPLADRKLVAGELPQHLRLGDDGRWRPRFARSAVIAAYGEMAKPPPLDRVAASTLLIRGADSEVVPEALVDVVCETMADCEVVTVPGGHIVMWDAFDETASALLAFLEDSRA